MSREQLKNALTDEQRLYINTFEIAETDRIVKEISIVISIVKGISIVISIVKGNYWKPLESFSSVHAVFLAPLMLLIAA